MTGVFFGLDAAAPAHHLDGGLAAHAVEDARMADQGFVRLREELAASLVGLARRIEDPGVFRGQGVSMLVELGEGEALSGAPAGVAPVLLERGEVEAPVAHIEVPGDPRGDLDAAGDRLGDARQRLERLLPRGLGDDPLPELELAGPIRERGRVEVVAG